MKKLCTLTLALVMVLSLAACGGKPQSPDTGDNPGGATAPDSATIPDDMPGPDEEIPGEITYSFADGVLTVSGRGEIVKDSWFSVVSEATYETDKNKLREAVKEIIIEEGTYAIGDKSFIDCRNLTKVSMPDSVNVIGESAFSRCSALTDITLSNQLVIIGTYAFIHCENLTHIDLPDSVTTLGHLAFQFSGLTEITIPASVTTWESGASPFSDCDSLTDITYLCDSDMDTMKQMIPKSPKQTITIHAAADSFVAGYIEKQHSEGNLSRFVFEPLS